MKDEYKQSYCNYVSFDAACDSLIANEVPSVTIHHSVGIGRLVKLA
jgi:hypothetical protein